MFPIFFADSIIKNNLWVVLSIIQNSRHTFDSSVKFVQLSTIPTNILIMRNQEFVKLFSSEYSTKCGDNVGFLPQYLYISKERRPSVLGKIADWFWLMLIGSDADTFSLILIDANLFWLMLIYSDWLLLVLIDADWCRLNLMYTDWC